MELKRLEGKNLNAESINNKVALLLSAASHTGDVICIMGYIIVNWKCIATIAPDINYVSWVSVAEGHFVIYFMRRVGKYSEHAER